MAFLKAQIEEWRVRSFYFAVGGKLHGISRKIVTEIKRRRRCESRSLIVVLENYVGYSQNRMTPMHSVCEQTADLPNVKPMVYIVNTLLSRDNRWKQHSLPCNISLIIRT